ncbi:hypothetical protein LCM23_06500 [Cytobacillus kochii]|uniref:hypothetical protein n=1 Tax=Cytobacillus kochii TaxID=859143 RepID=UPI001CD5D65C|nr:hypothetical protein [Cytobacillus kochii]MCA1025736.1 hypothetical protein [Cytobacillus kochii]
MESLTRIVDAFKFQEQIAERLKEATNLSIDISKLIRNAINESLQGINEYDWPALFKETEDDMIVFKFAIVSMGYPPPHSMDIPTMRMIANSYKEDKEYTKSIIDQLMVDYYNDEVIEIIHDSWEAKEILKKRIHILRKVIMGYKLGFHDLVIPTLLAQFEGLLVDCFKIDDNVGGKIISALLEELLLKDSNAEWDFDEAIHYYYTKNLLATFKHGKKLKSLISRNAILHGADIKYGIAQNSIKVILLFDYIVHCLEDISEETISKGQERVEEIRLK